MDLSSTVKQIFANKLLNLLKSIDGMKDLVLDKDLMCSLDCFLNFSQLQNAGVEKVIILKPGASPGLLNKCLYLVRPSVKVMKVIADHINANRHTENIKSFWIIYVPRKLHICEFVLEREGVFGYVNQMEFPLGFIALDKDIFSLELNDYYKSFYLKGDQTYLHTSAISLVQLFNIFGSVSNIYGHGKCAHMVIELMKTMMNESKANVPDGENISDLIIVDRDVDYASMLLSQLTYEGLLDETFSINSGRVLFPKEVTNKQEPMKVLLNSDNLVFEKIRNCHFTSVFSHLRERAKQLQSQTATSNMSIEDMKQFVSNEVKNIQQQQATLALHIGACEYIMGYKNENNFQEQLRIEHDILEGQNLKGCLSFIEDIINKQDSILCALRLLCLLSITQDGLQSKDYKQIITQLLQSYGHKHLVTIQNLKTTGLLHEQNPIPSVSSNSGAVKATKIAEKVATAVVFSRNSTFKAVSKKLNLIPNEGDSLDLKDPVHMSYVFSGSYTPIMCKIAEQVISNNNLKNIEDGLKILPGKTISILNPQKNQSTPKEEKPKAVIVYFLGGVTYAEIAALRLLSKLNGRQILIFCTSVISGNSVMKMLMPDET